LKQQAQYPFLEETSRNLVQNNDGRLFVLVAQDEGTWVLVPFKAFNVDFNLLAPELFFLILAHPVYKI